MKGKILIILLCFIIMLILNSCKNLMKNKNDMEYKIKSEVKTKITKLEKIEEKNMIMNNLENSDQILSPKEVSKYFRLMNTY